MKRSNKPFNGYGNEKEQKVKCVIDTNILMAALLNRTGAPAKIIERFRNAEFELATSESIVGEYREVILEFENERETKSSVSKANMVNLLFQPKMRSIMVTAIVAQTFLSAKRQAGMLAPLK